MEEKMGAIADFIGIAVGANVATKQLLCRYDANDFIPDGEAVKVETLQFRKTNNFELFQCCQQTGDDMQSGPYYCGKIADMVAGNKKKHVGLCKQHANRCSSTLRWATPDAKDSLIAGG